ncbi:ABC transporter permease subunit [Salmonella enterica]|uniref:ABC transporter permease subunit n=1 Tax=Salmonella enterica TaxID=28901 RepID=UPI00092E991F|nr:substrate-binding domain-containing protein [Salmonella enterica]
MTTQAVSGRRYFTKAWLLEQKSLIALLVLIAIVSTLSPNFFTVNNLFNILQQTSVNAIMAVGMTLVILTSGIDLSVGSLLALTGAVAASIVGVEVNALVAVAAALALGAAIGAVTGVIVAKGRVQAFIATLTTIHQPKDELGELAIDVLIHRMAQPALQQQRLQLTPVLTVRGSV